MLDVEVEHFLDACKNGRSLTTRLGDVSGRVCLDLALDAPLGVATLGIRAGLAPEDVLDFLPGPKPIAVSLLEIAHSDISPLGVRRHHSGNPTPQWDSLGGKNGYER